jgi:hypothetical protein
MKMKSSKGTLAVIIVIILLLVGSQLIIISNTPHAGDKVIVKEDVSLLDWNYPATLKPTTCLLKQGQVVTVDTIVTYPLGSTDEITILWVKECFGGALIDHFKLLK